MREKSSYGPDWALVACWALLCSPPALAAAYDLLGDPTYDNLVGFCWLLAFPAFPIAFACRFRATFGATEFAYRRWGQTIRVRYSDIDRIEVTNVAPISKQPIGAFLVTKSGERWPFWPKLFPADAVKRFFAMAR